MPFIPLSEYDKSGQDDRYALTILPIWTLSIMFCWLRYLKHLPVFKKC